MFREWDMQIYIDKLEVYTVQPMQHMQRWHIPHETHENICELARRLLEPDISLTWQGAGSYNLALNSNKGSRNGCPELGGRCQLCEKLSPGPPAATSGKLCVAEQNTCQASGQQIQP